LPSSTVPVIKPTARTGFIDKTSPDFQAPLAD